MDTSYYVPDKTEAWQNLKRYAQKQGVDVRHEFELDSERSRVFSVRTNELFLDYSKNLINSEIWTDLIALAENSPLQQMKNSMFSGKKINTSENRAVLHTLLRKNQASEIDELDKLLKKVKGQSQNIKKVSERIRSGLWLGVDGKPITDVVNIGIGGSDLGPRLACNALAEFRHPKINTHFVGNVDGAEILSTLNKLDPQRTLIIIASKTFKTQETLMNGNTAIKWLRQNLKIADPQKTDHLIAVTANPNNALEFGVNESNILQFSDWVGGRYSLWSSIGISIAISAGYDRFHEMLVGAQEMDEHFLTAPTGKSMPVALALLSIWYSSFLNLETHAVIPYCERLQLLPSYLQQLAMESNGKSVSRQGQPLDYATSPVIWGQTGTNGQHAFFQLLHQGSHTIPIDFIAACSDAMSTPKHHEALIGNMLAQGSALMLGQSASPSKMHQHYPGNNPSNTILIDKLSAKNFGALIALYEHKVFVEGCIWNINSFDQWGVELGKKMANNLISSEGSLPNLDASTRSLFAHQRARSGMY
ncbi:MAG: glucose-6-phosphate isomerase [Cellvibrionales bacterium TMED148]|nr:glucose-6-phosphate isomerase [Porticoccaceae bacterium]RPG88792.1 MAG: glucose-6-phosphate isomerase [Cellvibrionales bacterium TMED148]|tara:strand:+ start:432 stop:2030 length:1599 start_codon:yes stop_codon:yes gene_type:complete